jgi:hypothetical protein
MLERWDSMAAMLRKQPHQLRVRYLEFEVVLSILEGLVELLDCSMLAADDFGSDLSLHRVPGASAFAAHALQMQARLTGSWSGGAHEFDMLLSAGVAAAFPVNLQLRHAVTAVYSSTAQWVGGFAPPLKLLPGMVKYKCKYLTAMGALLQSQQAPLVLRLDAIPVSSELHQASQQLSAAAMGLDRCAATVGRQVSEVRVVPVLASVMQSKDGGNNWGQIDVMRQLKRCWSVRNELLQQQQQQLAGKKTMQQLP